MFYNDEFLCTLLQKRQKQTKKYDLKEVLCRQTNTSKELYVKKTEFFLRKMEKYGIFCWSDCCSVFFLIDFSTCFSLHLRIFEEWFLVWKNVKICNKMNKKPKDRIYIRRFLKQNTWIKCGKKYHINILEVNWVKINEII